MTLPGGVLARACARHRGGIDECCRRKNSLCAFPLIKTGQVPLAPFSTWQAGALSSRLSDGRRMSRSMSPLSPPGIFVSHYLAKSKWQQWNRPTSLDGPLPILRAIDPSWQSSSASRSRVRVEYV